MEPVVRPEMLTTADWEALVRGLTYLWLWAGCAVVAALAMLVGHGMIPSLLETESIPRGLRFARPPLYLVAAVGTAAAIYLLAQVALIYAAVFLRIYPRFWV